MSNNCEHNVVARARELVIAYGWNSTVYQLLNPGMQLWFSVQGDAVVGYVESGGFRVVAAAPVCSDARFADVVDEFESNSRAAGLCVCYFAAGERLARVLARRGPLDRVLLGAEPQWNPQNWERVLERKASLRAQLYRARNKGVWVDEWSAERARHHPELQRCLGEWLQTRRLPPMHFLIEPDTLDNVDDRRVFVAQQHGCVVGFLVASPVPMQRGWLVEQIIRGDCAPNGTNELLVDAAMRQLGAAGSSMVSLGLAPLSHHADAVVQLPRTAPALLLSWVRLHGRRFYNFEGLDAFKAKFLPDRWVPVYAITNEPRVTLRTLYAIAGAFSGSSPLFFLVRSVKRAAQQEARWLWQRIVSSVGRG